MLPQSWVIGSSSHGCRWLVSLPCSWGTTFLPEVSQMLYPLGDLFLEHSLPQLLWDSSHPLEQEAWVHCECGCTLRAEA